MTRKLFLLLIIALVAVAVLAACNQEQAAEEQPPDFTIIETGIEPGTDPQAEQEADFVDRGAETTVADLSRAQAKITSFYFEQRMEYADGAVFLQVWYAAGRMKLLSSVDGYGLSEFYYDYEQQTMIRYYPGSGEDATQEHFDPHSADAPNNPVSEDYESYTLLGAEEIDRQYCLILQTPQGDKLWVGTKYGFPLKTEYVDETSGFTRSSLYKNVKINTITEEDVAPPEEFTR
jgi:hypothetical protein